MKTTSYEYPLDQRVFHVDDECYVVYLGSSREDYKPFLRIGNSRHLSESVISSIYTIAVTDSLTGDPLLEPKNLNRKELQDNRYVGSEETVDRMFRFLKQLDVKTEKIPYHKEFKTEDQRAILTMFDNGNLSLTYDNRQIFDLRKRERSDLHFVERSKWLKDQLLKNHCRYPADVFTKPGFFKLEKTLFLFSQQSLTAFGLPEDYFPALVSAGIDPDLISSAVTGELTSDFIKLCKRKQFRGEPVSLLTSKTALFQSVFDLFESRYGESLKYNLEDLAKAGEKRIGDWSVSKAGQDLVIGHARLPWPIRLTQKLSSRNQKDFLINPWRSLAAPPAAMQSATREEGFKLADGIPYLFSPGISATQDDRILFGKYFAELASFFSENRTAAETNAIEFIGRAFEDYRAGRETAGHIDMARKHLGDVKLDSSHPLYFLFHNAGEICRYLARESQADRERSNDRTRSVDPKRPAGTSRSEDRSRTLSTLEGAVDRLVESVGEVKARIPLVADCYVSEEGTFTFYRFVKSSIKKQELALTREIVKEAGERLSAKHPFFLSERERLISHLKALSAPLPRKKAAEEKPAETAAGKAAGRPAASAQTGAEAAAAAGKPELLPKKESRLGRTLLIIAGALAVLAAVLLVPPLSLLDRSMKAMGLRQEESAAEGAYTEGVGTEAGKEGTGSGGSVQEELQAVRIPEADRVRIQTLISGTPVEITVLDIYRLVNIVATASGFWKLDEKPDNRRDPNWIYPGDRLSLPEGAQHGVVKGDTIWWVSARFIKAQLNRDWNTLKSITGSLNRSDASAVSSALEKLHALKKGSYCANFRKEVDKNIREIQAK